MSESSADILGLGPNNAFQIFCQPGLQIDNGYFNNLIMAHTKILVHMGVGPGQAFWCCFRRT